jgi:hypothetical protein
MTEISTSIRVRAHRRNIERYHKLLAGRLTRVEREYVMRRIAEEQAELAHLDKAADDPPSRQSAGQSAGRA